MKSEQNTCFKHYAFIETQEELDILKSETNETLYIDNQTEDGYIFKTDNYIKISKYWYVEETNNFKYDKLKNQNDNLKLGIAFMGWIPIMCENSKSRYIFAIVVLLSRSIDDLLMYSYLVVGLCSAYGIILLISASITSIFLSCFYKQDDIMELLNKV
jgi:hypothetical protein